METLEQIVYTAAFHLREPLRSIILFGKHLRRELEGRSTGHALEHVTCMSDRVNDILQLIEQLPSYWTSATSGDTDREGSEQQRTAALELSLAELRERTVALEQIFATVVCNLQEPLRPILTSGQCLWRELEGQLTSPALEYVTLIIRATNDMRLLIHELGQLVRVIRHEDAKEVDCTAVLAQVRASCKIAIDESGVAIHVADLPSLSGSAEQLALSLAHLIDNAVKYRSPDRPGRVEVGSRRHEEGWLFWVRDNGIGIEPRFFRRIFELGERLHAWPQFPGWGYGLAICEKVVIRHGGRIWVTSEPGQGSTFYFTLSEGYAEKTRP
jgi:light-regulated signal transduction histidine kinase (bacteriophytochrome)